MATLNGDKTAFNDDPENGNHPNPESSSTSNEKDSHNHNHDVTHHHTHNHEGDQNGGGVFQINVKLPHEPYKISLTVSSQEQIQDIRQSIVETPGTAQYTCFHLEHGGERVGDFVEVSEVKGLQAGSDIVLVEDPYTEKDARMHLVRIRELLGLAGDRVDQLHGIGAGLSLYETFFGGEASKDDQSASHPLTGFDLNSTPDFDCIVPSKKENLPKTLKSLVVSPWNPPPHHLRQRGHLLYLQLTTNEGEQFHITSAVSGFFVNRSSSNKLDPFPRAAPKNHNAHSLLSLIALISPSFNTALRELHETNNRKDLLSTFPFQNAIPANPWLVPPASSPINQHQPDQTRPQETYLVGGTDNIENLRDWNEEFQSTKELPKDTIQDRVFQERLTSKLFADYNDAAARGAVLVVRGEVAALNPNEGRDDQIFVYNNIFYSFGADGAKTFADEGGDEAARVAVAKDVSGVRAVNQLDIPDLFTAGTVVVDYLGKRVVAQSIVPGIFKQREPGEPGVDYGRAEGKATVATNPAFVPGFEKLSKALYVKKHAVWDSEQNRHEVEASVEVKGLLGTDGRKYVLDLYRIAPLDVAWADEVVSPDSEDFGPYPHRMAVLRQEVVESYRRLKLQEFAKREIEKKKKHSTEKESEAPKPLANGDAESEGDKPPPEQTEEKSSEPEDKSVSTEQELVNLSNFSFALNPDVGSGQTPQSEEDQQQYSQDEEEVRAVCEFLRSQVLPELIQDLYDNEVGYPLDGHSLSQLLHKRGINVRYLGKIAIMAKAKGKRLNSLAALAVQEMVARAFKHVANRFLGGLPSVFAASCFSHLLNCLLGAKLSSKPEAQIDDDLKDLYRDADFSFAKVMPASLKAEIETTVTTRFRYRLPTGWETELKPYQILREICLKTGLQLGLRTFSFGPASGEQEVVKPLTNGVSQSNGLTNGHALDEPKKKKKKAVDHGISNGIPSKPVTTFVPDDILNIVPIVKDAAPRSALAEEALEAGRISLQQNQKQLGQELLLESLSLHEQIYGILHPEVAKVYHQLSMIYFQTDEKAAAVDLARKAVIVTERTLGLDSTDTVLAYLNLSLYEHAMGHTPMALSYIKHALNLWKIVYGPDHPDSITTMNNAAVMLQTMKEYSDSRRWFEASLKSCEELFGRQSVNVATILFQLAQALALDQDSKGAVNRMREAYNIFHSELGADDKNTKEAESWLEQLTQNAVSIAKQAKDIQNRRLRRYQLTSNYSLGTQPQVTLGRTSAERATGSSISASRPKGLDSRSIDELLKFIEGAESGTLNQAKQKKRNKTINPKLRGRRGGSVSLGVGA